MKITNIIILGILVWRYRWFPQRDPCVSPTACVQRVMRIFLLPFFNSVVRRHLELGCMEWGMWGCWIDLSVNLWPGTCCGGRGDVESNWKRNKLFLYITMLSQRKGPDSPIRSGNYQPDSQVKIRRGCASLTNGCGKGRGRVATLGLAVSLKGS